MFINKEKFNQLTAENLQLKKQLKALQNEKNTIYKSYNEEFQDNIILHKSVIEQKKLVEAKDLELVSMQNKYITLIKTIKETLENQSATIEESSASIQEISASAETITEKLQSSTDDTKKAHNITIDFQKRYIN